MGVSDGQTPAHGAHAHARGCGTSVAASDTALPEKKCASSQSRAQLPWPLTILRSKESQNDVRPKRAAGGWEGKKTAVVSLPVGAEELGERRCADEVQRGRVGVDENGAGGEPARCTLVEAHRQARDLFCEGRTALKRKRGVCGGVCACVGVLCWVCVVFGVGVYMLVVEV